MIDANATVAPPRTLTFSRLGQEIGVPFLGMVSLSAYNGKQSVFDRIAERIGYHGSQTEYQREVEEALRAAIIEMASTDGNTPTGIWYPALQ